MYLTAVELRAGCHPKLWMHGSASSILFVSPGNYTGTLSENPRFLPIVATVVAGFGGDQAPVPFLKPMTAFLGELCG
jgi:hypothetical protein